MTTKLPGTILLAVSIGVAFSTIIRGEETKLPKEVSALLADYQREFTKVKEPADKVLRTEGTRIAAKLVEQGNADGAKLVGAQVEDKVAGKAVASADPELVKLFGQYDSALTAAAKPVRDKYNQRVAGLLQGSAGKDMGMVMALGEAKKVIAGELPRLSAASNQASAGKSPSAAGSSSIANPARGKKTLAAIAESKTWEFSTGGGGYGVISFDKRGGLRWMGSNGKISQKTWQANDDFISVSDNYFEFRFDAGGDSGEVVFIGQNLRHPLTPSTKKIPEK